MNISIRDLYSLKVKCQEIFKSVDFCCSDNRHKENHSAENLDKNACPFKSYVSLFIAEGFYST